MEIHLDNSRGLGGLGDMLCILSFLCEIPETVEIKVTNNRKTFDTLTTFKRVLKISDESLIITQTDTEGDCLHHGAGGWPIKLLSKYYTTDTVNLFGEDLNIQHAKPRKGYIGLVCYNSGKDYLDDEGNYYQLESIGTDKVLIGSTNNWPQCRYRSIQYYSQVFAFCKTHGYDVINLESETLLFEEKVELMTKYCKAIIGYEGGIAHLAHTLKIPYFMLNWNLPSDSTIYGEFHCELVHQSPYMYLLKDDELFKWSPAELELKIDQVKNGSGNNRLVNGHHYLEFENNKINGNISIVKPTGEIAMKLGGMFGYDQIATILEYYYLTREGQWKLNNYVAVAERPIASDCKSEKP